ncbi:MAG: HAD family phosphatase [Synergistaceae bacterium]|jgi:HAD superfamily hydrolase (TIGR01509 family)|nr:HAD family phosphatase [Synergistaceae bacterium]
MMIAPPFWHPSVARGFILDWDGVLADTKLDFAPIRAKYFKGERVPLVEAADMLEESRREDLERDLYELEMEGARGAEPVQGAHELLEWLRMWKIPWAVVSRNCRDSIFEAAKRCSIELPETVMSRDEGPLKPDPQALWAAAGAIGVEPSLCLMVGDFIFDLYGARRAGMRAVLVERVVPEWDKWADISFQRLEDLVRSLGSPEPMVPGEYRELAGKRGRKWLERAWEIDAALPEASPEIFAVALAAVGLGIGGLKLPEKARLSLEQWERAHFLPLSLVDRPIVSVLTQVLGERFPQVNFSRNGASLELPGDPDLVEEAVLSWMK